MYNTKVKWSASYYYEALHLYTFEAASCCGFSRLLRSKCTIHSLVVVARMSHLRFYQFHVDNPYFHGRNTGTGIFSLVLFKVSLYLIFWSSSQQFTRICCLFFFFFFYRMNPVLTPAIFSYVLAKFGADQLSGSPNHLCNTTSFTNYA